MRCGTPRRLRDWPGSAAPSRVYRTDRRPRRCAPWSPSPPRTPSRAACERRTGLAGLHRGTSVARSRVAPCDGSHRRGRVPSRGACLGRACLGSTASAPIRTAHRDRRHARRRLRRSGARIPARRACLQARRPGLIGGWVRVIEQHAVRDRTARRAIGREVAGQCRARCRRGRSWARHRALAAEDVVAVDANGLFARQARPERGRAVANAAARTPGVGC